MRKTKLADVKVTSGYASELDEFFSKSVCKGRNIEIDKFAVVFREITNKRFNIDELVTSFMSGQATTGW